MPRPVETETTKTKIPSSFNYLMDHQKTGLLITQTNDYYGFWDDMGVGKTAMMIAVIQMTGLKTLVVCPRGVIKTAWIKDLKKFAPEWLPYYVNLWELWKKRKNIGGQLKYETNLKHCKIGIVNYESFKSQIEHIWNAGFKMVILDESTRIRDPKSSIAKMMIEYCDTIQYVYLLCGEPAPNHYLEYYNQIRVMDKKIFGRSYYAFRNTYFRPPNKAVKEVHYVMKYEMKQKFLDKLKSVSRVVFKEDVLDLPEKTFNIREVTMDAVETKAHKEMKRHLYTLFKDVEYVAANSAVKIMRLRQITAGFLISADKRVTRLGKSKLDELILLLDEIGNHQVLISVQFHPEGDQIEKYFSDYNAIPSHEHKKTWGRYDGTVSYKQQDKAIEDFMAKRTQYLICHPKSMGHGTDGLQHVCSYGIHFSVSYSSDADRQWNSRLHRNEQKNICTYYYLLAANSIDLVIYRAFRNKQDVSMAVLRYIQGR